MDKYFAPENAELNIVFQKGGGRMGKNAQLPFTIQFKADGKPAAVSPADVKAVITGPAQVLCQTRGAANRYSVTCCTDTPGKYTANITVRDKFKASGSFYVYANTCPAKAIIEGAANATANPHKILVKMVDDNGVPLEIALGDAIQLGVRAPEGAVGPLSSADNDNGTFTISIDLKKKGQNIELNLQVNGVDTGKPYSFTS